MTDSTLTQIKHERDRNYASALYHKRKRVAAEAREAALLDRLAALEAERAADKARVVELLRPFADKAALIAEDEDEDYCPEWSPFIPVRAYRNAAATLAKQGPGS